MRSLEALLKDVEEDSRIPDAVKHLLRALVCAELHEHQAPVNPTIDYCRRNPEDPAAWQMFLHALDRFVGEYGWRLLPNSAYAPGCGATIYLRAAHRRTED